MVIITAAGAKTINASYVGDSNFNSSTSAGVSHTVRDFSISRSPTSQTIKAGQKTTYKLTLTSLNGFSGSVSLSCAGLPPNSTCSFSPSSVSLSTSASSTVTVQTSKTTSKGTYTLTFTGLFGSGVPASGGLTHSVNVSLVVQ